MDQQFLRTIFESSGNLRRINLPQSQVSYQALQHFVDEQIQEGHALSSIDKKRIDSRRSTTHIGNKKRTPVLITLFLKENGQTEAFSIQNEKKQGQKRSI
ncbi:MAG: hypothetical protein KDE19_00115 [Caldilineaceae bacterium]|nr:hypothetical protein [Caldilineaceae bacterium]